VCVCVCVCVCVFHFGVLREFSITSIALTKCLFWGGKMVSSKTHSIWRLKSKSEMCYLLGVALVISALRDFKTVKWGYIESLPHGGVSENHSFSIQMLIMY
jgi:hypothetical protein